MLAVDVRCACGLDIGPRQYGINPGGALPCEPDTVRSRVITSTFKGINPSRGTNPAGGEGLELKVGVILLIPVLSLGSSSPLRDTRRSGTDSTLREGRPVISKGEPKGNRVSNTKWGLCCLN